MKNSNCGFSIAIFLLIAFMCGCYARGPAKVGPAEIISSGAGPDTTDYEIIGVRKTWNAILADVFVRDEKKIKAINDAIKKRFTQNDDEKDKTLLIFYFDSRTAALADNKRAVGNLDNQPEMDSILAHRLAIFTFNPPKFERWDFKPH